MLVTIATFSFPHEAHLAKAQLDAFDIPSFIADGHTINMYWLFSNAMGGVRLQVPKEFAAQAQELLDGPVEIAPIPESEIGPEPESVVCPNCGGALSKPYTAGKRPAFITWLFLGFPLWPIKKVRRCMVCNKITKA
ncbi:MAG: DUF2007 domain-containing protein [Betaproteobacteria bacterium]|nr:DUF2007 domain-containing protein [Betaproteobacteria bacterium]